MRLAMMLPSEPRTVACQQSNRVLVKLLFRFLGRPVMIRHQKVGAQLIFETAATCVDVIKHSGRNRAGIDSHCGIVTAGTRVDKAYGILGRTGRWRVINAFLAVHSLLFLDGFERKGNARMQCLERVRDDACREFYLRRKWM